MSKKTSRNSSIVDMSLNESIMPVSGQDGIDGFTSAKLVACMIAALEITSQQTIKDLKAQPYQLNKLMTNKAWKLVSLDTSIKQSKLQSWFQKTYHKPIKSNRSMSQVKEEPTKKVPVRNASVIDQPPKEKEKVDLTSFMVPYQNFKRDTTGLERQNSLVSTVAETPKPIQSSSSEEYEAPADFKPLIGNFATIDGIPPPIPQIVELPPPPPKIPQNGLSYVSMQQSFKVNQKFQEGKVVFADKFLYVFGNNFGKIDPENQKNFTQIPMPKIAPKFRKNHSITGLNNGNFVIFGGESENQFLNDFWHYNSRTNSWSQLSTKNAPAARSGHVMLLIQNKLVLFGGKNKQFLNDFWIFDFKVKNWSMIEGQQLPSPRAFATITKISKNKAVLFGGVSDQGLVQDSHILINLNWKPLKMQIPARFDHSCINIRENAMLIFSGTGKEKFLNDFWVVDFEKGMEKKMGIEINLDGTSLAMTVEILGSGISSQLKRDFGGQDFIDICDGVPDSTAELFSVYLYGNRLSRIDFCVIGETTISRKEMLDIDIEEGRQGGVDLSDDNADDMVYNRYKQDNMNVAQLSQMPTMPDQVMPMMNSLPQMNSLNQMPQMNQLPQMNQMAQMNQLPQMNQFQQIPQMNQFAAMNPLNQMAAMQIQPMAQVPQYVPPPIVQQIEKAPSFDIETVHPALLEFQETLVQAFSKIKQQMKENGTKQQQIDVNFEQLTTNLKNLEDLADELIDDQNDGKMKRIQELEAENDILMKKIEKIEKILIFSQNIGINSKMGLIGTEQKEVVEEQVIRNVEFDSLDEVDQVIARMAD